MILPFVFCFVLFFSGALGFMVTTDGLTGNYGFLDQQAALRFVRDNIANFGGNPNMVCNKIIVLQRFRITDYGEFLDSSLRNQEPS